MNQNHTKETEIIYPETIVSLTKEIIGKDGEPKYESPSFFNNLLGGKDLLLNFLEKKNEAGEGTGEFKFNLSEEYFFARGEKRWKIKEAFDIYLAKKKEELEKKKRTRRKKQITIVRQERREVSTSCWTGRENSPSH